MSMQHITKLTVKQTITKRQLLKYNNLLSLPYSKLLQQLTQSIHNKQSNKQGNIGIDKQLMLLSAHHQCNYLYSLIKNSRPTILTNTNIEHNNHSIIGQPWFAITNSGLNSLFIQNNAANTTNYYVKSTIQISQIMTYLQSVRQVFTQSLNQQKNAQTAHKAINSVMQIAVFGIPTVYNTFDMNAKEKQILKQQYILTLNTIFNSLSSHSNFMLSNLKVTKLLPIQLFNYTDQPLIKDIYMNHLQHHFKLTNYNETISWVARFGLSCDLYIQEWVQLCNKTISNPNYMKMSQNAKISEDLKQCNHLFVIIRKILGLHAIDFKFNQKKLVFLVKQILQQMHIFNIFINFNNSKQKEDSHRIQQLLNHICDSAFSQQVSKQQAIKQLKRNLSNKLSLQLKQTEQIKKSNIKSMIEYKLIRMLILYLHMSMLQKQNSNIELIKSLKQIMNHPKFFNYVNKLIYVGDIAAELNFVNQKYLSFFGEQLFQLEGPCFQLLKQKNSQYSNLIYKIKTNDLSNLNTKKLWSRRYCTEHLLNGQSRLCYNNNTIFSPAKNQQANQLIVFSLLNDNQFMSAHVTNGLQKLLQLKLNQNLHLNVEECKFQNYPYFPALAVTYKHQQAKKIYLRDNICKHTRIKLSQPHKILDVSRIENIQKMIKQYGN